MKSALERGREPRTSGRRQLARPPETVVREVGRRVTTRPTRYTDPRAHELRDRYVATFGGDEIPVPVESIAEDLLGLRIDEDDLGECSGMLFPAERLIVVNAFEAMSGETPTRRHRFTIAHE